MASRRAITRAQAAKYRSATRAGKSAGAKIGRPTAEQSEIARLRRQLDVAQRRLSRTEAALDIMGKTHALLEEISKSAPDQSAPKKR